MHVYIYYYYFLFFSPELLVHQTCIPSSSRRLPAQTRFTAAMFPSEQDLHAARSRVAHRSLLVLTQVQQWLSGWLDPSQTWKSSSSSRVCTAQENPFLCIRHTPQDANLLYVCTYMGIRYPGSLPRVAEIFLDAVDRVSVRHACGMSHLVVAYYEDMTDPRWPQQTAAAVNGRAFRTRGRWVRLRVGLPLHCCCCA